ncbi:Fur family transcriptional regulator [Plastoroseomonas arctica]|uniref:Transcriptional repressor n=1 Tax=Plastoroseomonas arctica TaxID=1509237 RepID=A0AAF1K3A9_9PROT|nr:Fur family transcriptional regulator [Plastoroseomonas arctica]MBR0655983.1 transcriptional repressor [Plastoroseomonas arctica]
MAEVSAALARAAAICGERGAQLTPLRRQVFSLILEAEAPIGAYALLDKLRGLRAGAAPPTVYRALDFLIAQGLVHKLERLNAFTPCVEAGHDHNHGHEHPHQFLICTQCGATAEICAPAVSAAIEAAARAEGFMPAGATVEVVGLCGACG